MVRNIPGSFGQRDIYTPRDQWSNEVDRYMSDAPNQYSSPDDSRSSGVTQPAIETALREQCGIHIKDFAMIATLENGETASFTSEKLVEHGKSLFNREFKETYFRHTGHGFQGQSSNDFDDTMRRHSDSTDSSNSRHNRHRSRKDFKQEDSDDEDSTVTLQKGRKRLRGSQAKTPERKPSMPQSMRMRSLRIGDTAEVTKFYEGRFRDIQQAACKIIAKAFIKVVEPRKQTNFPYTGGVDRAPAWWPTEARVGAPHGVKHKEPDHLLKPARITLLVHILRLAAMKGMEKEHVTIKELQLKTKEVMLIWYNDKPENKAKSKFLDEIFKVARHEERYRNGEIDGTYTVQVMHGADQGPAEISEDEGEDDANDEEEDTLSSTMTPSSSQMCTPESAMVSPISAHSIHRPMSGHTVSSFGPFQPQREVPTRQFSNASNSNHIHSRSEDHPSYESDALGMGVQNYLPSRMGDMQHNQSHGLPDSSRRPTWPPPSTFATNSGVAFPNWPSSNMMGTGSVSYNYHSATTPTSLRPNDPILPLPNTSSTSLLPPMHHHNAGRHQQNFNDSPTMAFRDHNGAHSGGGNPNNSLRSNSLSAHQYHPQHAAYNMHEYMQDYSQADAVMKDEALGGGGGSGGN